MAVSKINGGHAPYRAETFRQIANAQVGRNGLLEIAGAITQVGSAISIPPFTAIQNGLIFTKDIVTSKTSPTMAVPYYLTVSSPTATNIDNLLFSFAQSPADITADQVLLGIYDASGWRLPELVSVEGLIDERRLQNIVSGRVGVFDGLKTSIVATDYVTTAGSLIDKSGERQSFLLGTLNPVLGGDPDWQRVDRILYRRPQDWTLRAGDLKFVRGGAFAPTPAHLYSRTAFAGTDAQYSKTVIASDNTAHVFCSVGTGGSYVLKYTKISSNRQTVAISESTIISGLTDTLFDVAIDSSDVIHIVYTDTGDIKYQRVDLVGAFVGTTFTASAQSSAKNPRCKLDPNHTSLYIVYEAMDGLLSQIYATSRDASSGGQALAIRKIAESGTSTSNNINPDLTFDRDFYLHIVWENLTNTSIYYQKFDSYFVAETAPVVVSNSVTHGLTTLSAGAKTPRVQMSDDMTLFIAFRQNKGSSLYGVSVWTPTSSVMTDLFSPSESILAFDLYVEPIFNGHAILSSRSASVDYTRLSGTDIDFNINLSSGTSAAVSMCVDTLGAALVSWQDPTTGGHIAKTPVESFLKAFNTEELAGDILLARLVQPDGVVLNWTDGGRPGSFYDLLIAHGQSVTIDWEVSAPNRFTLGAGLKIFDMFSGVDYTLAAGNYDILDGEGLYVVLGGVNTSVTPVAAHTSIIPWDDMAVVLGINKDGKFNPAVMGMAGMVQMDSGEGVIFGEDLPQSMRARIGIIDETHFQAYSSAIGANTSDTYPQAISNIDIMAGQNRHVRPVRLAGSWGKDAAGEFKLDSSCYIQIPGLPEARNEIQAQTKTLVDGEVAYVSLNRVAGAAATLTVTITALASLVPTRNTFILARCIGTNLVIDSLGRLFKPGDTIAEVSDEALKRVRVIDRVSSALPTGASVTIDGTALVNGDRVLFANSSLNKIYILHGVGSAISWAASSEFEGSSVPTSKTCVQVYDGGEINKTIWTYDSVKGWYRISSYQDTAEVRAMDLTTAALPTGAGPLVIDTVTIAEGELVLFGNAALNRVYRVTGIGSALSFEAVNLFKGLLAPQDGSRVLAQDGTVSDVMWEYDEDLGLWSAITLTYQNKTYLGLTSPAKAGGTFVDQLTVGQLNNIVEENDSIEEAIKRLDIRQDTLKKVKAVDLLSVTLPTGATYFTDGVAFVDGDKALFVRPALNGIYQISGVGTAISWTKLYEFGGSQDAGPKDTVFVAQGAKTNRTIWMYDALYNPPWVKLIDPDFIAAFAAVIAQHTLEINQLQDTLNGILANKPDFEEFTAGAGGSSTFTLTRFTVDPDNSIMDIYVFWNGRWQAISTAGDFSDGQFRKNSSTEIEMAESIPEGETVAVYMWDPAAMFVRTIKIQKFAANLGGQSIFTLDPLVFTVEPGNSVIDCEFCIDGRWQTQSISGTFSDGAVRKNSSTQIETAEPVPYGKEFVVIRRVPVGTAPGYSGGGGGGGGADLTAVTTDIGFVTPHSVGTLLSPADSLVIKDQVTSDIWKIEVVSGVLQAVKVN